MYIAMNTGGDGFGVGGSVYTAVDTGGDGLGVGSVYMQWVQEMMDLG